MYTYYQGSIKSVALGETKKTKIFATEAEAEIEIGVMMEEYEKAIANRLEQHKFPKNAKNMTIIAIVQKFFTNVRRI